MKSTNRLFGSVNQYWLIVLGGFVILGGCDLIPWDCWPIDSEGEYATEPETPTSNDDGDTDTATAQDTNMNPDSDSCDFECRCTAEGNWYDGDTGLCWQNPSSDEIMEWFDAFSYCDDIDSNEYGAWRLPEIGELESLLIQCDDMDDCDEMGGPDDNPMGCYWNPVLDGECYWYWSSTYPDGDPSNAVLLFYGEGFIYEGTGQYLSLGYVRCVKGG
jgi:hypothetical protein